ncbi:MAG: (Fe-S)-binding protein [Armatimonadetes bacterium]|nr:(Fe-S)-binding protein [Armatimonadota bacterium]
MKAYGHLLERDNEYRERAAAFSLRVRDISEFLAETGFEPPKKAIRARKIAYQDACHLAHGQGIKDAPRELLASLPGVQLVELKESDMCCGSAGVYNLTQPVLARRLLERKWRCIEESGAEIIASGNPGCLAWIQQAARERRSPIRVVHTAVLLAEAYLG